MCPRCIWGCLDLGQLCVVGGRSDGRALGKPKIQAPHLLLPSSLWLLALLWPGDRSIMYLFYFCYGALWWCGTSASREGTRVTTLILLLSFFCSRIVMRVVASPVFAAATVNARAAGLATTAEEPGQCPSRSLSSSSAMHFHPATLSYTDVWLCQTF